jgi:hypothetical protein
MHSLHTERLNSCSVAHFSWHARKVQLPHQTAVHGLETACLSANARSNMPVSWSTAHSGCVKVGRGAVMQFTSLRTDSREDNQSKNLTRPPPPPHRLLHISQSTRIYTPTQRNCSCGWSATTIKSTPSAVRAPLQATLRSCQNRLGSVTSLRQPRRSHCHRGKVLLRPSSIKGDHSKFKHACRKRGTLWSRI